MPSYIMVFFTNKDIHRIYNRNYTIEDVGRFSNIKPISSLQDFVNTLSRPDSIGYVTFVCVVSAIGIFGEYCCCCCLSMCKLIRKIHKLIRKIHMHIYMYPHSVYT